jgi:hypothetical protein
MDCAEFPQTCTIAPSKSPFEYRWSPYLWKMSMTNDLSLCALLARAMEI